ncbi:MAG: helix-turn-helix domain-containing protein [Planctomycetota bacterium]
MAKATIQAERDRLTCRYLYHGFYDDPLPGAGTQRHEHPFWHVDCFLAGAAEVETDGQTRILACRQCVVIPAGVRHRFRYPGRGARWLSVKCELAGPLPGDDAWVLPASPVSAAVVDALCRVLPPIGPADTRTAATAGHLLASLLAGETTRRTDERRPPLQRQVETYLLRHAGRRVTVADLAGAIGYSPSHLSATFRRQTGQTLKPFLDGVRADLARQRLRYSDEPVSAVALALGFPDIYSFSRFFKRCTGQSPTHFRRDHGGRTFSPGSAEDAPDRSPAGQIAGDRTRPT